MEYRAKLAYDSSLLNEALLGFWRRGILRRLLLPLAVLVAMAAYLWTSGDRSWAMGAIGTLLLFCVGLVVAVYFVHRANMRLRLKSMGAPEALFTAAESSFTVVSGAGSSTIPWSSIGEVWKLKRCWLLILSNAQFITIPLADIPPEMRSYMLQRISGSGGKCDD
jgi:hypothetical protein